MVVMADRDGTWLVLVRDVSDVVHVQGRARLAAGLVVDVGTGLLRGVAVEPTDREVLAHVVTIAVKKPAGGLRPGWPATVLCGPGLARPVAEALGAVRGAPPLPPITEVRPPAVAEDLFDSLIGHMAGRSQPLELPAPEDWGVLYAQALDFCRAEPWARWHDAIDLVLDVTVAGETAQHGLVVMGNAGLQRGLVLFPGEAVPSGLRDWEPGQAMPAPTGTLLCTLGPPAEVPPDLSAKALRYGWPPDAGLIAAFLRFGPGTEAGDPGRLDVQRLSVALAAVIAQDARGPVLAGAATEATTGEVVLSGGNPASFAIRQRPPADEAATVRSPAAHQVGSDLVTDGTPVVLGHLTWESLGSLRRTARIHRPFPPEAPGPSGAEVPLLAVLTQRDEGEPMAAGAAELDPYGVAVIETGDGRAVFALVGANGAEVLTETAADGPGLRAFQSRLRNTKGLHVVMIADEATMTKGNGTVYGLFECHQPPPPARAPRSPRQSPRPKRRRR
jgi:hypothetical protein